MGNNFCIIYRICLGFVFVFNLSRNIFFPSYVKKIPPYSEWSHLVSKHKIFSALTDIIQLYRLFYTNGRKSLAFSYNSFFYLWTFSLNFVSIQEKIKSGLKCIGSFNFLSTKCWWCFSKRKWEVKSLLRIYTKLFSLRFMF